jgi:hypothetical protein
MGNVSLATSQVLDAELTETRPRGSTATTHGTEDRCDRALSGDIDATTTLEPIFIRPDGRFALFRA